MNARLDRKEQYSIFEGSELGEKGRIGRREKVVIFVGERRGGE